MRRTEGNEESRRRVSIARRYLHLKAKGAGDDGGFEQKGALKNESTFRATSPRRNDSNRKEIAEIQICGPRTDFSDFSRHFELSGVKLLVGGKNKLSWLLTLLDLPQAKVRVAAEQTRTPA